MKFLKLLVLILSLFIFSKALALDAPTNIVLDDKTDNSLSISWDAVDWASIYAVSYWTKSASWAWDDFEYEHELEDDNIVTDTNTILKNLMPDTIYYIAIKAFNDNEESSDYSKEVAFKTNPLLNSLKIEDYNLIDTRNIELNFNSNLKEDWLVDINLVNKNDDTDNVIVENYTITWKTLKLFLDKDLQKNNTYNLIVLALEWANWESIEEWVNWQIEFDVPEDLPIYSEDNIQELNSAWQDDIQEEDSTSEDKEATGSTDDNTEGLNKVLKWKVLDSKETDNKIVEKVAKENKKLPRTWPADMLLFLFFAFFASW